MRRLSAEERRRYDEDGYVVVPNVFAADEMEALDREIDRLLEEGRGMNDHRAGWVMGLGLSSEITKRFAKETRILALIEKVVRPGIAIHSAKMVAKLPHSDVPCHWHQDEAYYYKGTEETRSESRMSVWVPLQDSDEHNGCLWVVPGSHTWGLRPHHRVDWGTCRQTLDDVERALAAAVPVRVEAGSVVLFSAWTWHHSKGNETDRVRRAFIVSYQEATLPGVQKDWKVLRRATG